ncbi:hypothetical protein KIF53_12245 [Chromobacterium subtsugae]|uniref:Uncharacterized protein n=1 Tax=Chromobacterium subtsugae TaxID=251747 RepID=A0ABS7FE91_9NEIS|nr:MULTISPECIES: DUF3309 domain-containing protein [Chromobacterium]MBW7566715.1 hypothetical protein [Chromobacterium subtsugae]MBW8288398.1 hypothetical protein [Chromobacterium subtsugae]WSE92291.1 hypothetical protein U6115_03310 [Chromobacterium subtsugae]WVH60669.1 hypothetical protein U6151_03330 [Chromobacterium subtsugae]
MKIFILLSLLIALVAYLSGNSVWWGLAPIGVAAILLLLLIVMALVQLKQRR